MNTVEEIKRAIQRLNFDGKHEVLSWLEEFVNSLYSASNVQEPQPVHAILNPPLMTFEEFLEFAEQSALRYEFVNGVVHAMTGASLAHNWVAVRLFSAADAHLQGAPCRVFPAGTNLRIQSDTDDVEYIPDFMVACDPEGWTDQWVRNPKLVAEVLSPSTQRTDRREKALIYRQVQSIEEYLLLEQSEPKVTVLRRADEWRPQIYTGTDAVLELRSIGLSVPLAQIYAGILPAG
jgi:Uma2 family endonuclease